MDIEKTLLHYSAELIGLNIGRYLISICEIPESPSKKGVLQQFLIESRLGIQCIYAKRIHHDI